MPKADAAPVCTAVPMATAGPMASWSYRERWWSSGRLWWRRAAAVAPDSRGVLAAAARSEHDVIQHDKAPLARGFVFAGYRADA